MSAEPRSVREVARFLRQQEDLGLDEIFLEEHTREQILSTVGEARAQEVARERGTAREHATVREHARPRTDPSEHC